MGRMHRGFRDYVYKLILILQIMYSFYNYISRTHFVVIQRVHDMFSYPTCPMTCQAQVEP